MEHSYIVHCVHTYIVSSTNAHSYVKERVGVGGGGREKWVEERERERERGEGWIEGERGGGEGGGERGEREISAYVRNARTVSV